MKNQSILLLILFSTLGISQGIKATFSQKFVSINNGVRIKPLIFNYISSSNTSIYRLIDREIIKKDSVQNADGYYDLIVGNTASNNEMFKDLTKITFLKEYTLYDTNFSIKDNLQIFEWELLETEQIIKGYKCKKAVSVKEKSKIIAWYCEDIPINDGPDRFYGLPGFILKVEIGEFSIIEIDQFKLLNKNIKIEPPINKSKHITMAEFVKQEFALFNKKANEN
jgi:GLPGLI family protein